MLKCFMRTWKNKDVLTLCSFTPTYKGFWTIMTVPVPAYYMLELSARKLARIHCKNPMLSHCILGNHSSLCHFEWTVILPS